MNEIEDVFHYTFFRRLKALPFVEAMWLFGSRARGDNQERSDIDMAIYCPRATSADWNAVLEIIDGADTLLKIDCVRFDELDDRSPLKEAIRTQGIRFYERT